MDKQPEKMPLKLLKNRVYRSYQGGKLIEQWQGEPNPKDGLQPEEWLASLVEARNSNPILGEGLSSVLTNAGEIKLVDLVKSSPEFFLGEQHVKKYGTTMAVLTKMLDSCVRLSIQVHPTKTYAREFFKSEYGKTEAWYIIGGREIAGEKPYVLAGFKPGITREIWKKYFDEQDIDGMINGLHKFEVKAGDVVLIEGGFPHAIGEGCFLIEIQEPTDYTMRIERKAFDGSTLADMLCHQGVGFDKMLDCFTYETLSAEQTRAKCFKSPQIIAEENGNQLISLISNADKPCFSMNKLIVKTAQTINDDSFKTLIVLHGNGLLLYGDNSISISQGDTYFIPAAQGNLTFKCHNDNSLEIILCYPPE